MATKAEEERARKEEADLREQRQAEASRRQQEDSRGNNPAAREEEAKRKAGDEGKADQEERRRQEAARNQNWVAYRKKALLYARPWMPGEDISNIAILPEDAAAHSPKSGDMIVYNPADQNEQWLVERNKFGVQYQLATEEEVEEAEKVMKGGDEHDDQAPKKPVDRSKPVQPKSPPTMASSQAGRATA